MPDIPLSPELAAKVRKIFSPEEAPTVMKLLETDCGSGLPRIDSQGLNGIERVRSAVLKLSGGSIEKLKDAIQTANRDWRDALVFAGFGDDVRQHLTWLADESDLGGLTR